VISAAVGGLTGSDPGSSFTERYKASVENENERMARAEKERGMLGTIVGGAASLPLGYATGGGAAATIPKLIGQGAALGAASGAAQHAESTDAAAQGAVEGGLVGGAASGLIGGAAKMLPGARRSATAEAQALKGKAPEELKAEAKPLFQSLDMGGLAFAQPQTATLKKGIDDLVASNQYNPIAHGKISGYVDELMQKAQQPQGMGYNELNNLRVALSKETRGTDASTREAASKVIEKIDELVAKNKPAINPANLDVDAISKEARQKWRSAGLAEDVGWVAGKAERKASAQAGANPDEVNRGAFRTVLNRVEKPGAYNPFGPKGSEQRDLLAKIVEGDKLQNAYRMAGRAVPAARIAAGLGAAALGIHGGLGPALGAGAAGGGLIQNTLNKMAAARGQQNIDTLLRNITTGSSAAPAYGAATSRGDLAQILAAQTAARAAAARGRY
jgi:hypothetical protein